MRRFTARVSSYNPKVETLNLISLMLQEGAFCLVARAVAANRCLSVADIAKREIRAQGGEVQSKCFFSGLMVSKKLLLLCFFSRLP